MTIAERIQRRINELPEPLQAEVLDFVDFLLSRTLQGEWREEGSDLEDREWSEFSLAMAARGMEDEVGPEYSQADLKERF